MPETTYRQAVATGIAQEMERDPSVVLHRRGRRRGRAACSSSPRACSSQFGPERVRDTPISEQAIVGAAMGAAMTGLRPGRRADVQRLLRRDLGHGRQPDREDPLHDRRPGLAAARHPHRERRGPPVRRPAQPEHRELGDGDPRAQGRRAVDPGRRRRADGGRDPRPRPGDLLRAQGACSRRRARCPTASTSCRSARPRSCARAATCTIVALAAMVPRAARGRRAPQRRPRHRRRGHRPAVRSSRSTSRRSSHSVEKTSRLFTVEENPRLCGWGAEIASIVADEGFYSLDAPIVRITTPHVPLPSRRGARGRRDPDRRPDRRHGPRPPRGGEVTEAVTTVGVVGTGPDGLRDGPRAARRPDSRCSSTTGRRDRAEALRGRDSGATVGRRAGGRRRRAPTSRSRCSPTTTRSRRRLPRAGRPARGRARRRASSST